MRSWLLSILSLALLVCACSETRAKTAPPLAYVERVIGDGATALPLVIAVHGLGDTPESFLQLYDGLDTPARIVAPRAPDPHAVGTSWYPIDDPRRAPQVIARRAELLLRLADHVAAAHPTRGRPIVTGFSQGGVLSFALAARAPERILAALPIAGMLPDAISIQRARAPFRVVALHGRTDARIPFARAEATVARFRQAGTDVALLDFPDVGHAIPPALEARYFAELRAVLARAAQP